MSVYISASLLEDYVSCSRKVYYRLAHSDQGIQNKEMVIGEIVHLAIERYWNDLSTGLEFISNEIESRLTGDVVAEGFANQCFNNYFDRFKPFLSHNDNIEYRFKIPYEKDVFIVGKMDRISNGKVFDWKTSRKPPKTVSNNIQFILYNWAFNKMYGANPSGVYYGALVTGSLIRYSVDEACDKTLFDDIIPDAIRAIKNKQYSRDGIFRKSCFRCQYANTCLKEFGNVMDNTALTEE